MTQYVHLDNNERTLIYWWLKDHLSIREMGRRLGRSHSTVSRELRRNLWFRNPNYFPSGAQTKYQIRLKKRAQRTRLKSLAIQQYVCEQIKKGWTPELISGRLKVFDPDRYVCHESIYQFIYHQATDLIPFLPRHHAKRRKKFPYRKPKERIKNRVSLEKRPSSANLREVCGHWESDTVEGANRKDSLNVIVDRNSRLTHITLLPNKTAAATRQAIIKRLKPYPNQLRSTLTYDNGSENTQHEIINESLGTKSFFCEPYHSWEKGTVEQRNGLIRRFFPKGTDFEKVSNSEINRVEKLLNNRPLKCLNYQTPYEVFRIACGALTH